MNSDDGILKAVFTLLGLAIFVVITCSKVTGSDHASAEQEFNKWAKQLDLVYHGKSCNNHDSDNDGYVTCSYTDANGDMHSVECAGSWSWQTGCRTPKPVIRVTNHNHR